MGVEPAIDITAEQRRTILTLLKRHLPCTTVWVYGSRAKWTSQPRSDLDMVVFTAPNQSSRVSLLREAFEDSDLPFRVDLFVWNEVPDSFRKQIESDHVVLATPGEKEPGAPDGWQDTNLGTVIELKRGYDLPKRARKPGSVPIVSSSGVTGHHSERKVPGPGVVTGRYGTLGQVFYITEDFWPLNTTLYVRDFKESDPRFIQYLLQDLDFSIYSDKAAVPGLNRNHLHQEPVRVPSDPSEQRTIAHILGTLDDKIDLNRRMNKTLEAMARAIFKDWFVDFGPTRAKGEGREPYLAPELWNLFPDNFNGDDKPFGWSKRSVYEFADIVYGAPFASKHFNTENIGIPLIRIRDLATHDPSVSTEQIHNKGHIIEPGDIVVGMDGEFRLHIWKGPRAWLNQRVCHFEPKSDVPKSFLAEALKEPLAYFERGKVGTTVIHLGKSDIDTFKLVYPGEQVLHAFANVAEPLIEKMVSNSLQARALAQTRDLLLPKLMSGEIRLQDAKKTVGSMA